MLETKDSMQFERSESDVNEHISIIRDQLLRYCEYLSGTRHEAEDVVQTTLLKALPILLGAKQHPNVSALLRRIAKNTWLDQIRKQGKCRLYNPSKLYSVCGSKPPEEQAEVEMALQVLLCRLTPQQRAVYLLCEVFEYTDREAGELLGISRGAVKATLHRAKVRLDVTQQNEDLPSDGDDGLKEVLQAYVAAFHAADITALIRLCQSGAVDPVYATSKVLTFAQTKTNLKNVNIGTQMTMLAAA